MLLIETYILGICKIDEDILIKMSNQMMNVILSKNPYTRNLGFLVLGRILIARKDLNTKKHRSFVPQNELCKITDLPEEFLHKEEAWLWPPIWHKSYTPQTPYYNCPLQIYRDNDLLYPGLLAKEDGYICQLLEVIITEHSFRREQELTKDAKQGGTALNPIQAIFQALMGGGGGGGGRQDLLTAHVMFVGKKRYIYIYIYI